MASQRCRPELRLTSPAQLRSSVPVPARLENTRSRSTWWTSTSAGSKNAGRLRSICLWLSASGTHRDNRRAFLFPVAIHIIVAGVADLFDREAEHPEHLAKNSDGINPPGKIRLGVTGQPFEARDSLLGLNQWRYHNNSLPGKPGD